MRKHLYYTGLLIAAMAMPLLTGCSDELSSEDKQTQVPQSGNVYVQLSINRVGNGLPRNSRVSRAGEEKTDSTPGTEAENAMHTIYLMVYDANTTRLENVIPFPKENLGNPIQVKLDNVSEGKHIYAAVNLPKGWEYLFKTGSSENLDWKSTGNTYGDVINEVIPGSDGSEEKFSKTAGGILLTGQATQQDGNSVITINSGNTEKNPLKLKADVSRVVAKVHVLAIVDENISGGTSGEKYVPVEDRGATGVTDKVMGWIRLSDVRYMPNGTNKSFYFFPQKNAENELSPWEDTNMNLTEYGKPADDYNGTKKWNEDFNYLNGLNQHKELISANSHFANAEKFDNDRLNLTLNKSDDSNRYTHGMYCLENYFDEPTNINDYEREKYTDGIPMVTQVAIAAKLTPKRLVVRNDYEQKMDDFVKEFTDNPQKFRTDYGLTDQEFTENDVTAWKDIKKRYAEYFASQGKYEWSHYRLVITDREEDSQHLMNWSLKYNKMWSRNSEDFQGGKYPNDTFFSYDAAEHPMSDKPADAKDYGYYFLTIGAYVKAAEENDEFKEYSVQHVGGWGYYYSYLNETGSQTDDGKTSFVNSQVTRNTYYLLHVNIGTPGGTITKPEYIKVNTQAVNWDYAGRGDLYLH